MRRSHLFEEAELRTCETFGGAAKRLNLKNGNVLDL